MQIEVLTVSPFAQNARILICEQTRQAVLVDPGDECERILNRVNQLGVKLKYILATHGHIDHIGAVRDIQDKLSLPFYIHQADQSFVESLPAQAAAFGIHCPGAPQVEKYITEQDVYEFGNCQCTVMHLPGHSPGSVGFIFGKDIISGDVLFAGSIGRTDLPGASFEVLSKSIYEKLYTLPDDTVVHPGHGPNTTLKREKLSNPFVKL